MSFLTLFREYVNTCVQQNGSRVSLLEKKKKFHLVTLLRESIRSCDIMIFIECFIEVGLQAERGTLCMYKPDVVISILTGIKFPIWSGKLKSVDLTFSFSMFLFSPPFSTLC